jgi:hypothetical protein
MLRAALLALLACTASDARRTVRDPEQRIGKLTQEAVQPHTLAVAGQSRRTLTVTFSDYTVGSRQGELVLSWVRNQKALQLPCVFALCSAQAPTRAEVGPLILEDHCAVLHVDIPECVTNPKVCRAYLARSFVAWKLDMFYTDADVALLRNPFDYFSSLFTAHPTIDLMTSSDSNTGVYDASDIVPRSQYKQPKTIWQRTYPEIAIPQGIVHKRELGVMPRFDEFINSTSSGYWDIGLENPGNCIPHQYNTGVLYVRGTAASAQLLDEWVASLQSTRGDPRADDQKPLNDVMKSDALFCTDGSGRFPRKRAPCGDDPRVNAVAGGMACLGLLNLAQFANGYTYAMGRNYEGFSVEPFTFHATYSENKVFSLQEQAAFYSGPEHYTDDKYLSFSLSLNVSALYSPLSEEAPAGYYTWTDNFYFVQHQLRQLRVAFALAARLNRVLILPRFAVTCQCFFYRGNRCVIEGHRVRLPHIAPTAHVLRVDRLPPIREPSFLETAPARVRASQEHRQLPDGYLSMLAPESYTSTVLHVKGEQLLAAYGAKEVQAIGSDFLGAWCCLAATDFPDFAVRGPHADVRIQYAYEGEPVVVGASDGIAGKCVV